MKWMFQNQVMQKRRSASDIHIYIYGHIISIRKASPHPAPVTQENHACSWLWEGSVEMRTTRNMIQVSATCGCAMGSMGKPPFFQVQKALPENGWLGRLMDTIIDGCLYKVSLWMLMDVSLMMDGCPIFIVLAVASPSRHQHHQRQIEPTRCQLEDLTQDDYFNGENMRNHWIGLRENLNRKPMGFYHQRQRAFRFQFSHHPILWRKWWLTNTYIWCDIQILTSGFWGTHGYPIFRPTQNTAGSFNNGLRNPEGTPCDSQKKIQIYMCYCQVTRDSCGKVIKIPCHGNSNIVDVYKFQTSMDWWPSHNMSSWFNFSPWHVWVRVKNWCPQNEMFNTTIKKNASALCWPKNSCLWRSCRVFLGLDIWMVLAEERLPMDVWNAKKEVQFSQRSVDAAYKSRWH